ncbi:uncharacterized protein BJ212DRAFT_1009649 [Suillus subaureus]|uniref:Actin cytoskeleton-regulatory complex protein SLA1 n=1 Tax=Suillus subaureus TaxID=48587 RepID=A0A9P7JG35_9AGAM|nr:uncharacterized protein BJ212DRAFT_1009649 [Suillus subaureus]KAG1820220.1 hypothetical protein BJ212DRAFT_1009649 [Suillus subaureus]
MSEHEQYLAVLKASYDYEPQSEDELAITENQIVLLLERTDDDWWKVKIKGESQEEDSPFGLVPAAYVEQAEHTSLVRAIYDYDSAAPGELSIKEDEVLMVFDREEDWILVQSKEGGKAGFVPGNYVEETTGVESTPAPAFVAPRIIIPPSPEPPARPLSVYVDPADRVAQSKAQARVSDEIKTWSVSEVDKKGKKKKGTLGIGNGSLFFASESDKTPVQKWQISDVGDISVEKNKHVHIDMGGPNATKLHFNVGSRDTADAVVEKLETSLTLASAEQSAAISPPPRSEVSSPVKKNGVSVRFTEESPAIIPPREPSGEEEEETEEDVQGTDDGEAAVALYDFEGTGSDELTVQEGERLWIIEKEGEEWWKCRNEHGIEGVVPASYLETTGGASVTAEPEDDGTAKREEQERLEAERKEEERREREHTEKERKKKEQEQRAKAAAAAAEADRKRREKEEAAAAAEAERRKRQEAAKRAQQKAERGQSSSPHPPISQTKPRESTSSAGRSSSDTHKNVPSAESTRIWHDRSGQFRVEAAFLGYSNGKLRLHKVNGVVIEVPSEKMSLEDIRYVERLNAKNDNSPAAPRRHSDDDDQPLALKQKEVVRRATMSAQPKKPQTDWFEFFLNAGCDIDDCTRYAASFERDKIDEAILPDTTESTMRSLGLREGDIIRVTKHIQQKFVKPKKDTSQEQLIRDEELARQLQEEENGTRSKGSSSPAPNLFAGPGGVLKNNTQRRGRPQPSKSLPPPSVDLNAITTASDQIKRTGSPLVMSPATFTPVQPPQRSSSTVPVTSGFEDDAWTNRPGSKPSVANYRAPSAPPAAATAPAVAPVSGAPAAPTPPPAPLVAPTQVAATGNGLAKTDADIFDQLARLSQLKTSRPSPSPAPASAPVAPSPPAVSPQPPVSYNGGLGMGSSPAPIGQHLQIQQTGAQGPRGPFAPVPANQSLLQPLVPTTTGFNNFVPTRPFNASPFQGQAPPPFLSAQPTGFPGTPQTLLSQPTGLPTSGPLLSQPTGMFGGSFGTYGARPPFQNTTMQQVQPNPTGVFAQSPFNNVVSFPSPVPSLYSQPPPPVPSIYSQPNTSSNTTPANIFAQMKSGTFASGNEHSGPQQAETYNALRVNRFVPQTTGWGFQPNNGFQPSGYTGY